MSNLTEQTPAQTYKSLLRVNDANDGLDGALRDVETGDGSKAPMKISTQKINLPKNALMIDGETITATATQLNVLDQGVDGGTF